MIKFFSKNKNQKGYALLFTIVIVSAISVITAGLTSTVYKQMILSSLAKDSQAAFYQADTASDCALYADLVMNRNTPFDQNEKPFSCGSVDGTNNLVIKPLSPSVLKGYDIVPTDDIIKEGGPCFRIYVTKTTTKNADGLDILQTKVQAKGYNICDPSNPRTVEREIETNYNL